MDCNKDEAIRARGIAEQKMEARDFFGARKVASRAHQLYPGLENIGQMILVCDVHCSAENKDYGNEKDWYGILKVAPTADDALIRKQYRKLALSLHPDKNKFPGAADAFTLIGEAQKVLLDREKRILYNIRRIPPGRSQVPMQHTRFQPDTRTHPGAPTNFNFTSELMTQQGPPSGVPGGQPTFWTACPFCYVKYKYYRALLNQLLSCPNCKESYTAHELNVSGTTRSRPASDENAANQGYDKASPQHTCKSQESKKIYQKKVPDETLAENPCKQSEFPSEAGQVSNSNVNKADAYGKINEGCLSGQYKMKNTKRRKTSAYSSEKSNSSESINSVEDTNVKGGANLAGKNYEHTQQRCSQSREDVTYSENPRDEDEEDYSFKQSKRVRCPCPTKACEVQNFSEASTHNCKEKKLKDGLSSKDSSQNTDLEDKNENDLSDLEPSIDPEKFESPEAEFSDFDKDKQASCFKVGQVWAIYDTLDVMPRFYAVITKIFSPAFKVGITWFEADPLDEYESKWISEGLPVSCGRFRLGSSEVTEDHPMFSHFMCSRNRSSCDTLKIFPRKGETWAIFKDWDLKWYSRVESKKKYDYEFVEVLSGYANNIGVHVAYLRKVKGFTCLFNRVVGERDSVLIPAKEIFRFSHRVPSFKMTGTERNDVPEGSFELDPASLPVDLVRISGPADLDVKRGNSNHDVPCPRLPSERVTHSLQTSKMGLEGYPFSAMNPESLAKSEKDASPQGPADGVEVKLKSDGDASSVDPKGKSEAKARPAELCSIVNTINSSSSDQREWSMDYSCMDSVNSAEDCIDMPLANAVPDPEFHEFDVERLMEKFEVGQFWAIYCDEDAMPRYYGQIKKMDPLPNFALHVGWFYACPPPKGVTHWHDKNMPIGCGTFKFQNSRPKKYTETGAFSHQVGVQPTKKKGVYRIFPRSGEVWAVYKNWSAQLNYDNLEDSEYEIVEILDVADGNVRVKFLERVAGFTSVYKLGAAAHGTVEIPMTEQLRFSHQIPAVRLTDERDGSLQGFWELDPAAIPSYLLCVD